MTKPARKVAARKARDTNPKATSKVGKAHKKLAAETLRNTSRKTDSQFEQMRGARARKARDTSPKATSKVGKAHKKLAAETLRTPRKTDSQFEQLRATHVPETLQALAEKNVAQAREQYERSKNTLKTALESWQKSFGAAGEGAIALNRRIVDISERNMNTGFDLATGLVRAKTLAEVVELHTTYWRKLFGGLQTEAEGQTNKSRVPTRNR